MDLLDIAIVKQLTGGGGGSGTDNYNDLSNLPKINDTTLSGNKSSSALGLQSEITSENKLDSDLIDDTDQDNKFVTSSEKNTWNGKQNAIDADHKLSSDLVDDANKTNKFVTSTEKNTWNAKQNAIDSDHKLSSSLVSFSTAEAAALASGIDSTKVGQISTNQTNILYALKTGANNLSPVDNVIFTEPAGYTDPISINLSAGDYVIRYKLTTTVNAAVAITYNGSEHTFYDSDAPYSDTVVTHNFTVTNSGTSFRFYFNQAATVSELMIVSKEVWDTVGHDFMPPSLPNYDLTYLEAEDRAALAEVVDSGAKNLLKCFDSYAAGGVTQTSSNGVVSATWTAIGSSNAYCRINEDLKLAPGRYVCTGMQASNVSYYLHLELDGTTVDNAETTEGFEFTVTNASATYRLFLGVKANTAAQSSPITVKPMICTKAAFGVSQKFVPYRGQANPTAYIQPTKDAKITSIDWGGYVVLPGNVCLFNIRCTVGTAIDAYGTLFTGLPKPIGNLASTGAALRCVSNVSEKINLRGDGTIVAVDESIPIGTLLLSGTYLCK